MCGYSYSARATTESGDGIMEGVIVEFDQALGSPGNLSIVLENLLHFPDSAVLTVSDALELQEASEQQF